MTGSSTTNDPEMDQLKVGDDSAPSVQENVTAEPGETVILPCRNPKNIPVKVLEWHRANSSQYVLSYRDEQLDSEDQDPSFINRVVVKDRNMTHGDLSLIMTNVTTNDTGIYECRAFQSGPSRMKREILVVSIVNLKVAHSGEFIKINKINFVIKMLQRALFYKMISNKSPIIHLCLQAKNLARLSMD